VTDPDRQLVEEARAYVSFRPEMAPVVNDLAARLAAVLDERDTLRDWIEHWSSAHLPVWLEEEVGAALAGEARLSAADQPVSSAEGRRAE
jgi:hypothetical protein